MILSRFRTKPRAADPGWRAPNDVIEQIATLTRELEQARAETKAANQRYADVCSDRDRLHKAHIEASAEAAELRHLPEEVRLLEGSLTRDKARTEDLARQLRLAREHLDRCDRWAMVTEETTAKRLADGLGDGA